jgi:hypothetical protein
VPSEYDESIGDVVKEVNSERRTCIKGEEKAGGSSRKCIKLSKENPKLELGVDVTME